MINSIDAKNILALLERVNLSAREVDVFVGLRIKLYDVAHGPVPDVDDPEMQKQPLAAGVTMGAPALSGTNEA